MGVPVIRIIVSWEELRRDYGGPPCRETPISIMLAILCEIATRNAILKP